MGTFLIQISPQLSSWGASVRRLESAFHLLSHLRMNRNVSTPNSRLSKNSRNTESKPQTVRVSTGNQTARFWLTSEQLELLLMLGLGFTAFNILKQIAAK